MEPTDFTIEELTFGLEGEGEEEEVEIKNVDLEKKPTGLELDPDACEIIEDGFGIIRRPDGDEVPTIVHRYTLINKNNIIVQVITYGATIISIRTPDKNGNLEDIVLGFENFEGYKSPRNPYFGSTVGRVSGVIPEHVFSFRGETHSVSNNFLDLHHSNGGYIGFDKVVWQAHINNGKLFLSYLSENNEEGFPGDLLVNRSYELTKDNELIIETTAHCSQPTPVDISTHLDWNLSTHLGGPKELYKHYLMVNADKYAQMNKRHMITGKLKRVAQTVLDLRIPRPLGKIIHRIPGGGYDHFMNVKRYGCYKGVVFAAKLIHPVTGRTVEVMTDQPGVRIYTQNNLYAEQHIIEAHPVSCWCHDPLLIAEQKRLKVLPEKVSESCRRKSNTSDKAVTSEEPERKSLPQNTDVQKVLKESPTYCPIYGKSGAGYLRHGGIRIVPVNFPEPVARKYNYNTFLCPGKDYTNITIFKFGNIFDKSHHNVCLPVNTILK